ncbi:MAG: hypothetical protein Q8R29_02095 [bacterium]|nr:hypothetical protein [bacterium]
MKRVIALSFLLVLLAAGHALGETVVTSKVLSNYLFEAGNLWHKTSVVQTDMKTSLSRGFYFYLWHSVGLNDKNLNSDFGDELDYTLGWEGSIKNYSFGTGLIYMDYYKIRAQPRGDILQLYFEIKRKFQIAKKFSLTPFCRVERISAAKGTSPKRQSHTHLGTENFLEHKKLAITQRIEFLLDRGAYGFQKSVIGKHQLALSYKLLGNLNLDPSLISSVPFGSLRDGRGKETQYGIGLSLKI